MVCFYFCFGLELFVMAGLWWWFLCLVITVTDGGIVLRVSDVVVDNFISDVLLFIEWYAV